MRMVQPIKNSVWLTKTATRHAWTREIQIAVIKALRSLFFYGTILEEGCRKLKTEFWIRNDHFCYYFRNNACAHIFPIQIDAFMVESEIVFLYCRRHFNFPKLPMKKNQKKNRRSKFDNAGWGHKTRWFRLEPSDYSSLRPLMRNLNQSANSTYMTTLAL